MAQAFKPTSGNHSETFGFAQVILDSLKHHEDDYVYRENDLRDVIKLCQENDISIIYDIYQDKYGKFDYAHLTPVRFFSDLGHECQQLERQEVTKNMAYRVLTPYSL